MSVKEIKERVAGAASHRWPVHFSALFVAFRLSGPRLPKNEVVVAIGGEGFYVMDQPFRVVVEIGYYELVEVFSSRSVYRTVCMSVCMYTDMYFLYPAFSVLSFLFYLISPLASFVSQHPIIYFLSICL